MKKINAYALFDHTGKLLVFEDKPEIYRTNKAALKALEKTPEATFSGPIHIVLKESMGGLIGL
jgi:hypothetical protein